MPKQKTKFGKRVNLYLSYDVIEILEKLTTNKSEFVERLIWREFKNAKKKK